jgi:hypothetical protein
MLDMTGSIRILIRSCDLYGCEPVPLSRDYGSKTCMAQSVEMLAFNPQNNIT